jgi:hypothetical protein
MMPRYFWVQTAPPREGHAGAIAEGHYVVEDGALSLTDAAGKPVADERYTRMLGPEDDEIIIARQLLRRRTLRSDAE